MTEAAAGTETTQTDTTQTTSQTAETGGQQQASAKFWEGFADQKLKDSPSVTKYETAEAMAAGLVAAEARLGVPADQLLKLPTKLDDPAAMEAIYKRLGRPDAPAGYNLAPPEGATPEVIAVTGKLAEAAHKAGLSPAQLKPIVELLNSETAAGDKAETERLARETAETQTTLKTEWGAKHETYKAEIGKLILDTVGAEGVEHLNAKGYGNDLVLMRMLAKFADMRAEPSSPGGEGGRADPGRALTPAQARVDRLALENDKETAAILRDRNHAQHKDLLAKRNALLAAENAKA